MRTALLILLFLSLVACQPVEHPSDPTRKSVLLADAKLRTLNKLKAPATAVFIDSLDDAARLVAADGTPSDLFRISVSVDAQNSFGAILRQRYYYVYEQTQPDSLAIGSYRLDDAF